VKPILAVVVLFMCLYALFPGLPADTGEDLVAKGEDIFFNETFGGNGRTCVTCHRPEDNWRITPAFIATLPDDDPLFIHEFAPEFRENFEKADLLREWGLVLMNPNGFVDLENDFVMRTVNSLRSVRTSIEGMPHEGMENQLDFMEPLTGWAGDGAPGDGSLRSFAIGAIIQHMPRTLAREPGVDFRLPTDEELDALEAFMLSLGRQEELSLPLPLKGDLALRGQDLFIDKDNKNGRCNVCHINAGASSLQASVLPQSRIVNLGSIVHATGEEFAPGMPTEVIPLDDGYKDTHQFNTPPVVEAADAGPLFHSGFVKSVEEAVDIYNLDTFRNSGVGVALTKRFGTETNLSASEVLAIGAFLRVINALDNIRETTELLESSLEKGFLERERASELIRRAAYETEDAIIVLDGVNLHPLAVGRLRRAEELIHSAREATFSRSGHVRDALAELRRAREILIES